MKKQRQTRSTYFLQKVVLSQLRNMTCTTASDHKVRCPCGVSVKRGSMIQVCFLNIGVVNSGNGPDSRVLVRNSRKQAEQYQRLYKELNHVTQFVRETGAIMQEFTQSGWTPEGS